MAQGARFASGKFAKAVSGRDGMKYDYREMVIEADTKLLVHRDEVDEPDPYRRLRGRIDAMALRNPRPDTDISEATPDIDGICQAQTIAGAGSLALNGALVSGGVATLDPHGNPKQVVITSAGDDRLIRFTVTGTLLSAVTYSETVNGANAGAANTVNAFYTVTGIRASGASASAVTAGTATDDTFFDHIEV